MDSTKRYVKWEGGLRGGLLGGHHRVSEVVCPPTYAYIDWLTCSLYYSMVNQNITKAKRDLGVLVQEKLSPDNTLTRLLERHGQLTNIKIWHFTWTNGLRNSLWQRSASRSEYATILWSPHKKKYINKIKRTQKAATKMVPNQTKFNRRGKTGKVRIAILKKRSHDCSSQGNEESELNDRDDLFIWNREVTRNIESKMK